MGSSPPGAVSAARRLQRLRLKLTLFYSLAAAVALVALTLIAIVVDIRQRDDAFRADIQHRLDLAYQLVGYDEDNQLDLSSFEDDPIASSSPQVYVFERPPAGSRSIRRAFGPAQPDLDLPGLEALANEAMVRDDQVEAELDTPDGTTATVVGQAVGDNGDRARAAVLVVGDPRPDDQAEGVLALSLWGCVALLVALSAGIGYLLAGRSIRPAAEALAQQERFLADAAHELRTPVARLRTAAEGALATDDPAVARSTLSSIVRLSEEAGSVVDNLLFSARLESGAVTVKPEKLRLDQLVGDVVEHHPGVRCTASSSVVTADPAMMRRAVDNLVANAVRHAPGSEVEVVVDGPVVTVRDRGPGIDPAVLPHLFDRFVTSPTTGGSGLGLGIVQEIAAAHGGTVAGRNRTDGQGAEFVLAIPATS